MSKLIKHPGTGESPFGVPAERALVAATPPDEEIFSLRRYFDVLRRRKWLILASAFVVCGLVALNLTAVTPLYRSTAILQIDPEMRLSPYPDPGMTPNFRAGNRLNTELAKLSSPQLAGTVIEKLELTENREFSQPIRQGFFPEALEAVLGRVKRLLRGGVGARAEAGPVQMSNRAARSRLRRYLSAREIRETTLVQVSFDSPDREVEPRWPTPWRRLSWKSSSPASTGRSRRPRSISRSSSRSSRRASRSPSSRWGRTREPGSSW